jgi:hypothetical protein
MHQNHILNMLTHDHFSFAVKIHSDQLSFDVERRTAIVSVRRTTHLQRKNLLTPN